MAKRPELKILTGELAGQTYEMRPNGLRLGRSSSNDITIPDEELSRNHCLFEPVGETGVRLTDLASANGTYLNGKMLGSDPVELSEGDRITVGTTEIRFGEEPAPQVATTVDLGLDGATATASGKRRSPIANMLWVLVVLLGGSAAWLVLKAPVEPPAPVRPLVETVPVLKELAYEKVEADSKGIFRYEVTCAADGVLRIKVDDATGENRHLTRSKPLSAESLASLGEILAWKNVKDIDREYAGLEPDPPALRSWRLKLVYGTRAHVITVTNTQEPESFRTIREKLEAFSKNELGVWALQYSREKLIQLANESVQLGRAKWEDREVNHGNLFAAIAAYREAGFYLETVNPKPDCAAEARQGLERATAELEKRYADKRFEADRAINLGQWGLARQELGVLLELIPDRADDRNREATAKLLDVEKRMKGAE